MGDARVKVGAVAIGRNEGERLVRCLLSLQQDDVRTVYVDSASSDGSPDVAEELGADVCALDLSRPFTAARARAEGLNRLLANAAELQYVQFVDGDCELEPSWIAISAAFLDSHPDYAAVCGRRRERFPDTSFYNSLADAEWNTPVGDAPACGGDALMRVAAYHAVGGFDPRMIAGEEPELCRRLTAAGWSIRRLDVPMTIHDAAMTRFGQWWNRAVRSGFGYIQAYWVTRGESASPLYCKELLRAIVWAGAVPLGAIAAAVALHPLALLTWPVVATAQFARVARREGPGRAALAVVGKYAELLGAARFVVRAANGRTGDTISYK